MEGGKNAKEMHFIGLKKKKECRLFIGNLASKGPGSIV